MMKVGIKISAVIVGFWLTVFFASVSVLFGQDYTYAVSYENSLFGTSSVKGGFVEASSPCNTYGAGSVASGSLNAHDNGFF